MSTTDNDITAQAGATTSPGIRRSNRTTKSRPAGTGAPPGPTGPIIRPLPAMAAPTGQDENTTEEQVPPNGFTTVVADGARHRDARRASTVNTVTAAPPTDENRLLLAAEFFNEEDTTNTTHPPQQPAPTQLEDKFEAIMHDNNTRFDDFTHDIIAKLDDANNTRFDSIVVKLDKAIDNAIINKIDDVVTEVTDRVLPLLTGQVTTQVSIAFDSHIAELRQKHTNIHNMDNSISTYKQQIDSKLSTLRDSTKTITDLQHQVIDIEQTMKLVDQAIRDGRLISVVDDYNSNNDVTNDNN